MLISVPLAKYCTVACHLAFRVEVGFDKLHALGLLSRFGLVQLVDEVKTGQLLHVGGGLCQHGLRVDVHGFLAA